MLELIIKVVLILIIQISSYFQQKKKRDIPNSMTHNVKISAKYFTLHIEKTNSKVNIILSIG